MDTATGLIERVSFLAATPAIVGVFVSLGVLLLVRRWQVQVLAMAALYFFVALLHTRIILPQVALIKALIGWLICMTLYVTGVSIDERQKRKDKEREKEKGDEQAQKPRPSRMPPDAPLRMLVLLAVMVVGTTGALHLPLPRVPTYVNFVCYMLGIGGLFLTGMAEDPLRVGAGLLVFLAGFDLFFGALEPSLAVAGLLGAGGFLIALVVTFLAVTQAAEEEQS